MICRTAEKLRLLVGFRPEPDKFVHIYPLQKRRAVRPLNLIFAVFTNPEPVAANDRAA
ncbi:hypothetical protein [Litoreibacter albidus]|uniref:hypothetical protein n=1 Tax=Litoreibacter albidus TaxID=670155 RepID=UPI003734FF2E